MAYDTASRTFTIYSEDVSLAGTRSITVEASLMNYSIIRTTAPVTTTIEIIDPCLNPLSLTSKPIANPPAYDYKTTTVPKVEIILD